MEDKSIVDILVYVCLKGSIRDAKRCVDEGADVNCAREDGVTPLMAAVCNGNTDLVRLLLSEGANPFVRNKYGCSVLHVCILKSHRVVFRELVSAFPGIVSFPSLLCDDQVWLPIDIAVNERDLWFVRGISMVKPMMTEKVEQLVLCMTASEREKVLSIISDEMAKHEKRMFESECNDASEKTKTKRRI